MTDIIKTNAIVIHSIRWSDTSKIVHLFTEEKGYMKAIAKGALRAKSQFRGVLENLNHVEIVISLKESRGLQIVSQASLNHSYSAIRGDLDATISALSMLELIKQLVHYNEQAQNLFRYLTNLLAVLNTAPTEKPLIYLVHFLIYLSEYLGFGWNLSHCRVCEKLPQHFPLKTDVVYGAVICAKCARTNHYQSTKLTQDQWKILKDLGNLSPEKLPEYVRDLSSEIRIQMILDVLLAHLNYHTEQTLQLRSLKMYVI